MDFKEFCKKSLDMNYKSPKGSNYEDNFPPVSNETWEKIEELNEINEKFKNKTSSGLKSELFDYVKKQKESGNDVNSQLDGIYSIMEGFLTGEELDNLRNLIEELKNDNNQTWRGYC